MLLATTMGHEEIATPYSNHIATPIVNVAYIAREISLVCRECKTFITCGIKDTVVRVAAKLPIISTVFIK
jgi:hypothetical protein